MNNIVVKKLRNYKELKADIVAIDIELAELNETIGIGAQQYTERVQSSNVGSAVEDQIERKMDKEEELEKLKAFKSREIMRIDNALSVLTEDEKEILTMSFIEKAKYWKIQDKFHISYPRIKQIEGEAVRKIEKYFV